MAWCWISAFPLSSSTIRRAAFRSAAMVRWTCAWTAPARLRRIWSIRCRNASLPTCCIEFGEERASRRIARAIVGRAQRRGGPGITTTARLAAIIRGVLPPDRSGIDPATRSFQALRIRVNDELGEIERGARPGQPAACAGRAAGRGVVPFAGGPHRQALHGRGGRPRRRRRRATIRAASPRGRRRASAC